MTAGQPSRLRICLITENLQPPFDEGKKKLVDSLIRAMSGRCHVTGISVGRGEPKTPGVVNVPANKLFLSLRLWAAIRKSRPHVVCYVPSSSLTVMGFIRCGVLRTLAPGAKLMAINMQPRRHGALSRWFLRLLCPDVVFAQDEIALDELSRLGCTTHFLPSGVDLDRFVPVDPERKKALRHQYGIPTSKYVVLHAGHIKASRNVEYFKNLPEGFQGIVMGGSSMGQERAVAQDLRQHGVVVLDTYQEHVEEVYQVADCYLFPVRSPDASIGVPLSVLEAMACNLPVVTYRFGGLPLLFSEGNGLIYASSQDELHQGLKTASQLPSVHTRKMVESLSWDKLASRFVALVASSGGAEFPVATTQTDGQPARGESI